tara:strand:+ start:713 stop:1054 length:342 start_codon:yes stop_codon:yes gene_type:complete
MSNILKKNRDDEKLKQIFKNFLQYYCIYENGNYIINNEIFKKYRINNKLDDFTKELMEFYHDSKKYFLERDITFNILTTILRHICKYLNIEYIKKIIYNKNNYIIQYHIYLIN